MKCSDCNGTGEVLYVGNDDDLIPNEYLPCDHCIGTGVEPPEDDLAEEPLLVV